MKLWIPLLLLAGSAPLAAAERTVEKQLAVPAGAPVRVVNVSGSIVVVGAARSDLRVSGQIGEAVERVDVVNDGGTIVVRVVLPKVSVSRRNGQANLTIEMPAGSRLETSTVSASQDVRGVAGAVQLSSVSGDLVARLAATEVQVKTVSGNVDLEGSGKPGKWRVTTVSGDMQLKQAGGALEISTVSGDAELAMTDLTQFRGRSTSGDIRLRGRLLRGADASVETVSGNTTLATDAAAGVTFNASSFSGEITTCFGERGQRSSGPGPGERLTTRRGDGGAEARVKSLSGNISLCDRM